MKNLKQNLRAFRYLALAGSVSLLFSCTKPKDLLGTTQEVYTFPGLASIETSEDGTLTLLWEKVPSKENVNYAVFRREKSGSFQFNNPFKMVNVSSIDIPPYALDKSYCFAVRFAITGIDADSNTKEICPDIPSLKSFTGIASAVSTGAGSVKVTWPEPTEAVDIQNYGIYLGTEFTTPYDTVAATALEKVVNGLPVDSIVTLGVRAIDKYGRTDSNTRTLSVEVLNNAPLAFKGLESATQTAARSVKLTWLSPAGLAKEFRVYKASGTHGSTPTVAYSTVEKTVSGTDSSVTIENLGDEQSHCFVIRSVSSGGQEDSNTEAKCVSLADAGAPVFSGITSAAFSAGAGVVSWDAAQGETTKYRVYYKSGSSMDYATASVAEVMAPATTYSLSGLSDNQNWTFAVRAVDGRNQSDTNTVTKTVYAGDLTPPVFNGLVSLVTVNGSETELKLTFNKSTDVDLNYYKFRYRVVGATSWTDASGTVPASSSATIEATLSGLLPATNYDVYIRAFDTSGNPSTNTAYLTRKTNDATPPTFNGITSTASAPSDASKARVSWSAATDAGGIKEYRVYYSTQSLVGKTLVRTATYPLNYNGTGQIINMSSAITSGTTFDVSGLSENTLYYFVVHAIDNSDNEDANTAQQSFTMPYFTPPAAPTGLGFSAGAGPTTNRQPFITGNSIAGYSVKIYVDATLYNTQAINTTGAFSIQLATLPNTSGNYAVTATHVNPSGIEGPTASVGTYQLSVDTPVATLTGAPTHGGGTNGNALAVTVGGTSVATYRYSFMLNQATTCANATYSSWIVIATTITDSLGSDGVKRLCVLGKSASGIEQEPANATVVDFTRSTTPPSAPTLAIKNPITNSTSLTHTPLISVTLGDVTGATHYCVKSGTSTPTTLSSDACFSATKPTTVTLPNPSVRTATTYTVYAWAMDSAGNVTSSPSTATISYFKPCDTGDLSGTGAVCTVTSAWTLTSGGITLGGQGSMTVSGTITGAYLEQSVFTLQGNFTVSAGGTVNANLNLTAVNVTVASGATFKANGLGQQGTAGVSGAGDGAGIYGAGGTGSGAGYGGAGGGVIGAYQDYAALTNTTNYPLGGATYGSAAEPNDYGSSGGAGDIAGAAGGGKIKINASGILTVNGTLSANGNSNTSSNGAGSGGSLWLIAGSVAGTGTLSVRGGLGSYYGIGGSGGGGRISLTSSNPFAGTVDVAGGILNTLYPTHLGEAGSFYTSYSNICQSGSLATTCVISQTVNLGDFYAISGAGNLTIANGGTLKVVHAMRSFSIAMTGNVTVESGGVINGNLTNLSAVNVTVDSGGLISANQMGYLPLGSTTQRSAAYVKHGTSHFYSNGGGGHGGVGGYAQSGRGPQSTRGMGGLTFGSRTSPVTWGAAGGTSGYFYNEVVRGGAGGGAIKISATGIITNNGIISANGANGSNSAATSSGGGAGGSLWLIASSVAGTGSLEAKGGDAGIGTGTAKSGGGAGGRISIDTSNRYSGTINLAGGADAGTGSSAGEVGYAYFSYSDQYCASSTSFATTCTINQTWRQMTGDAWSGTNITIANGGQLFATRGDIVSMNLTGTLTIQSGGVIWANFNSLVAANVTINSGGILKADALGSETNYNNAASGSGAGGWSSGYGGGGGGYGGAGGRAMHAISPGGSTFGSSTNPTAFGGAGSGADDVTGGRGGGLLILNVSGTLTVNGTLSVKGGGVDGVFHSDNTTGGGGGGGAGGSINVTANTVAGNGTISANGGAASSGTDYHGGGGGGGRIAITRSTDTFSGTRTATGGARGAGHGSTLNGSDGTVVLQ